MSSMDGLLIEMDWLFSWYESGLMLELIRRSLGSFGWGEKEKTELVHIWTMDPLSPLSLFPDSDKQGWNDPSQLFLFYSGPPKENFLGPLLVTGSSSEQAVKWSVCKLLISIQHNWIPHVFWIFENWWVLSRNIGWAEICLLEIK